MGQVQLRSAPISYVELNDIHKAPTVKDGRTEIGYGVRLVVRNGMNQPHGAIGGRTETS